MGVCMPTVSMWRSEDKSVRLVFSFNLHVAFWGQTPSMRLGQASAFTQLFSLLNWAWLKKKSVSV